MKKQSSVIGIDLGGTKTALALFDTATMTPRASKIFPTEAHKGFSAVIDLLLKEVNVIRCTDTIAIGLGIPGFIDPKSQQVISMPNIPDSSGKDLRKWISESTNLPVSLENDARCFALAEALAGSGMGHRIVLGITLGTGVGGGIVIDGELFHGAHGYAGEVGHALLVPGQTLYPTEDQRGDVEQYISGTAMGRRCEAAKRPQDYLEGQVCGFLQPEVLREVAWLVVNAMHFIDPSIIIFGGSAGRALKPHLASIEKELQNWLLDGMSTPKIVCSSLEDSAVRGAALLAIKDFSNIH